ncbi:unknown [Acidaminococcus sp. CAG:542]|nr:unknown [Acidaminococcus sp. CAG:542]
MGFFGFRPLSCRFFPNRSSLGPFGSRLLRLGSSLFSGFVQPFGSLFPLGSFRLPGSSYWLGSLGSGGRLGFRTCRLLRCFRLCRCGLGRRFHRFHHLGGFHGFLFPLLGSLGFLSGPTAVSIAHRLHILQGLDLVKRFRSLRGFRFGRCRLRHRGLRFCLLLSGKGFRTQDNGIGTFRQLRLGYQRFRRLQDLFRFAAGPVGLHKAVAVQAQIVPVVPKKAPDEHIPRNLVEISLFQGCQIGFPDTGMFGNLFQGQMFGFPVLL